MQLLPLFLASASLAAASQQQATVTVTNYRPFEQHPCYEYFMLGGAGHVPSETCQSGACCIGVKEINPKTEHGNNIGPDDHPMTPESQSPGGGHHTGGNNFTNDGNFPSGSSSEDIPSASVATTSPPNKSSKPNPSGSVVTKVSSNGSVRLTIVEIITNNRTFTEDITAATVETLSETSRETEVITTTVPEVVTFASTSSGMPIVETSTTEVRTSETITTDVAILTTETELITTPSVVVTPTLTTVTTTIVEPVTSLIPPPPEPSEEREIPSSCPTPTCAHGIQYALYENPFRGDTSPTYESFSPAYFKNTPPVYNATLQTAIFITDDNVNGSGFNPLFRNAAAGYRGFLFACQAGRYRFNSLYADDITLMWFGDAAHSGYTREDADIVQAYYGDNRPKDVYRDLEAGTYYPIRVLWGNTGGASDLSLRIYGPDGRDVAGADHAGEHYLTTEACDGSWAAFLPWGEEK